jgi:hypothetical protein
MRNMSFMLTKQQIYNRTKTVTRRLGWNFAHPGLEIMACEKCQGLKPGEKIVKITPIRVVQATWEDLNTITQEEVLKEGFPGMTPDEFVEMFCREMECPPNQDVRRIEFEYVLSPYKPSKSTDGHAFTGRFCDRCWHARLAEKHPEKGCNILMRAFFFEINEDEYPTEWVTDGTWQGTRCTKFQTFADHQKNIVRRGPRIPKNQLSLFGASNGQRN